MRYHHVQFNEKTKSLSQTVFLASTNAVYTQAHTHITIALGEMQCVCISPKIKAYCDDLAINGFERGFNEGTRFILDTYIYFRYPCIKITQTNIYSQLARISFLCTIFLVFLIY